MTGISTITSFDIVIFAIISISTIFALFRGFIKSFLYFFGWVLSAIIVIDYYPLVSNYLKQHISSQVLINITASCGFYIVLLLFFTLINSKLVGFAKNIRGGAVDRSLGLAFGFARGCIISCTLFWSLTILLSVWHDKDEPEWLSKSESYKLLDLGTNYMVTLIASDTKRNELLKLIDKRKKFKAIDSPEQNIEKSIDENIDDIKDIDYVDDVPVEKSENKASKTIEDEFDLKIDEEVENQ